MRDRRKGRQTFDVALITTLGLNLIIAVYFYGKLTQAVEDIQQRVTVIENKIDQHMSAWPRMPTR